MKKVLIICDLFPPAFGPRMGYLCKYLRLYGWEPSVVTEAVTDEHAFSFLSDSCTVKRVNYYSPEKGRKQRLQWLNIQLRDFLYGYKDRKLYKKAEALYKEESFDLVLCSSFRTFPLLAARMVAEKHKLPLVVDLRDIIEQYAGKEYLSHHIPSLLGLGTCISNFVVRKSLRIRNQVLGKASYVTTISPWHVETLRKYNPDTELIYNGYDPEIFYPEQIPTRHFIITYTGRLLSTAMRDPELLMEALSILIRNKEVDPSDCQAHWYVDDASREVISEVAARHNVLPYMHFKGYVPGSEIPYILNSSSILLLLTNKASGSGPKGVMTTKFFESLAVEKPILCVRSDESHLAEAIKESHAGLAATHVDEVCDFIKHHYKIWKEKGYTTSSIDRQVLHRYSRKEQAGQFASIFDKLT